MPLASERACTVALGNPPPIQNAEGLRRGGIARGDESGLKR